MQLRCPVCGYEYRRLWVSSGEMTTCQRCGVGFVAGETSTSRIGTPEPAKKPLVGEGKATDNSASSSPTRSASSLKKSLAIVGSAVTALILLAKGGKILFAVSQLLAGGSGSADLRVMDLQTRMLSSQVCECSGTVVNQSSRPVREVSVRIKVLDGGTGTQIPGGIHAFVGRIEAGGTGHFSGVCPVPDTGSHPAFPGGGQGWPGTGPVRPPVPYGGSAWPGSGGSRVDRSFRCELESVSGSY